MALFNPLHLRVLASHLESQESVLLVAFEATRGRAGELLSALERNRTLRATLSRLQGEVAALNAEFDQASKSLEDRDV